MGNKLLASYNVLSSLGISNVWVDLEYIGKDLKCAIYVLDLNLSIFK
jgi:hypothetical protein